MFCPCIILVFVSDTSILAVTLISSCQSVLHGSSNDEAMYVFVISFW